jgi:hypothetical protein
MAYLNAVMCVDPIIYIFQRVIDTASSAKKLFGCCLLCPHLSRELRRSEVAVKYSGMGTFIVD